MTTTTEPTALLKKLNFAPPCYGWTRPDPRGSDYGSWHAVPKHGHEGVYIAATFYPASPASSLFTLHFATPADFERWVAHAF